MDGGFHFCDKFSRRSLCGVPNLNIERYNMSKPEVSLNSIREARGRIAGAIYFAWFVVMSVKLIGIDKKQY